MEFKWPVVDEDDYRGCKVQIVQDEDSYGCNPRGDCNLTRFVFAPHRNYEMPNEIDFPFIDDGMDDDPEDGGKREDETAWAWFVRTLTEKYGTLAVYPVGMIDHSGTSYYLGGGAHACDPGGWDSGTIGVAIITQEGLDDCGTPPESWEEVARAEIEEYSAWANGEVYGWVAVDPDGETIESVWGYIMADSDATEQAEYMKSEARWAIDYYLNDRDERANAFAADSMTELLEVTG